MERFACSRVKDLSQFVLWVIAERGLDIHETECHLNLDKGGDVLKLTLTIIQEQEVEGEPLSSGVKKSFIVCGIAKVEESHPVIKYVFDKTNVKDVRHVGTHDFKVDNASSGIGSHGSSYNCHLCEAHKDHFVTTYKPTRTVRSLFENYEKY